MAITPTLGGLTGSGVPGQRLALDQDGAAVWRDAEIVNVREYGVLGDGADETAAIQALLDAMKSGVVKRRRLIFPEPVGGTEYVITAALKPDQGRIAIEGASRFGCVINQHTANTPVLLWDDDGGGDRAYIRVAHLTLKHNNAPDATTTQQYGIQFRANPDGTAASGAGYFQNDFTALDIRRAYVGIGAWASGTGTCPIWATRCRGVNFFDTKHHAIKLTSEPSSGVIGQPFNTISHVGVFNSDAAIVNEAEAIRVIGGTGIAIHHLNVEDWRNELLYASGGSYLTLAGLRTERHVLDRDGGQNVIYLASGQFDLSGIDFGHTIIKHASGTARIVRADAGALVSVRAGSFFRDASSTSNGTTASLWAPGGTAMTADGIVVNNGVNLFLGSAFGDGQYGLIRVNGLPPAWDAAPTASASYRGRSYRAEGGASVADVEYRCLKSAADAYAWKAVVSG